MKYISYKTHLYNAGFILVFSEFYHELHDSIEHPAFLEAQSGRF